MTPSKFTLRQEYLKIRHDIPSLYRTEAALAATKLFTKQNYFKESEHIACYLPFKDEFLTAPLMDAIWQAKKACYVPVLAPDHKVLQFVLYEYGDALHLNRYKILEPVNLQRTLAPVELDLVITPLLAFDLHGHRLGTGGGYYDCTFAFLQQPDAKKLPLIGLGFAAQYAAALPTDPWDVLLNGVITEKTIHSW